MHITPARHRQYEVYAVKILRVEELSSQVQG
jgi:hypothetical protein